MKNTADKPLFRVLGVFDCTFIDNSKLIAGVITIPLDEDDELK